MIAVGAIYTTKHKQGHYSIIGEFVKGIRPPQRNLLTISKNIIYYGIEGIII